MAISILLSLASVLLLVTTLLPLSRSEVWWIRGWDFPRLQLFYVACGLIITQLIWQNWQNILAYPVFFTTVLCACYQGWWILPYIPLYPQEVGSATDDNEDRCISILTANVLMTNRRAGELIDLIIEYRPDIFVTLESDHWWQQQLDTLQTTYPYSVKCPLDNLYGMHVYSKLELLEPQVEFLIEKDVPSMTCKILLRGRDTVRMHFLHPAPPSPTENEESTERDAELVLIARRVAGQDNPVIVTGDMNDVAWSATTRLFRKISGLLDPRIGRGIFNTFHTDYPFFRWPLDHLFHSTHFRLRQLRRLPGFGSDHFPLYTQLCFQPEHRQLHTAPQAQQEDQQRANEKLAKAGDASP